MRTRSADAGGRAAWAGEAARHRCVSSSVSARMYHDFGASAARSGASVGWARTARGSSISAERLAGPGSTVSRTV